MSPTISLWQFACDTYEQPGVESACLALQDQQGWDIPLLFFCCWSGRYYGALSTQQIQQTRQFVTSFSDLTTRPLRGIRRTMKTAYADDWPLNESQWQSLRAQIKGLELASERLLLQGLESEIQGRNPSVGTLDDVLANICRTYELRSASILPDALNPVLRAVFSGQEPEAIAAVIKNHQL